MAEKTLLAAGFPARLPFPTGLHLPVLPREGPNFGSRLIRAVRPVFRLLFPNQVVRADDLAWAMVDVVLRETQERQSLILENRDIRAMVKSKIPVRDRVE